MTNLAIVIPYYKISFFEECLSSLVRQSNREFRVYIGDDASPEDPSIILDKYQQNLDCTYIKFEENIGQRSLTEQWNRCIALIKKEQWVILLGDDDRLSENCVEEFYKNLEKINSLDAKVIRYSTQEINGEGVIISKRFLHPRIQSYNDVFHARFYGGSRSSLSEYIFSLKQYKKVGFRNFPLGWHADDMAWLEFSEFGIIYTINEGVVYFRISDRNISRPNYLAELKKETSYMFFEIVVREYLCKFEKNTAKKIFQTFEGLTYFFKKGNLFFWFLYFPVILKRFGLMESIKFTRRLIIN